MSRHLIRFATPLTPDLTSRPIALLGHDPRRAIGDTSIVCLICGRGFRQLTNTHLRSHGTGPAAYRRTFGYNARRALMCHELRRRYAERAVRNNLAGRIRQRPIVADPWDAITDEAQIQSEAVAALELLAVHRRRRGRREIGDAGESVAASAPLGLEQLPALAQVGATDLRDVRERLHARC